MQRASSLLKSKFSSVAFTKRWIIYCPFDFKSFVGYEEIEAYLTTLGARVIGCSKEGRKLLSLRVGEGPVCVLEAGIHAREWASPMAALYAVDKIINEPIPGLTWIIVPLLNPDGYEYSRKSKSTRFWRKNMNKTKSLWCNGVDINRNFSYRWGDPAGCSKLPCMDTFCGLGPWSERESMAMSTLLGDEKDIRVYFSVHACQQAIMYPPACTSEKPIDIEDLEGVAKEMSAAIKSRYGKEYEVGQSSVISRLTAESKTQRTWTPQDSTLKSSLWKITGSGR
ncbi:carboxypeptidase B1 isoform X2 [Halyomorpha halys]|uniref:carboxypeptidase B1 isoform X2 n=1 Tax=Halyomorpha halys TaxID=286706 RepID=UPI0006D50066|nr:carboxypeptidase B isoform X2 [Halyomorpha halys]